MLVICSYIFFFVLHLMLRLVSVVGKHESDSHSVNQSPCYFSLRERKRVTGPCLASRRRHTSAIYWGLVSSQKALMEACFGILTRRPCSLRDGGVSTGENRESSLSVKPLKGDKTSAERRAAPRPLILFLPSTRADANAHRQLPHRGLCERQSQ